MCVFHKCKIVIKFRTPVVASYNDFQRDAAHTRKCEKGELYLLDTPLHLCYLSCAFGTGDVE